jgi:hypothetical protein
MGIYYSLLNDTKRESVHLDHHVKREPLTKNAAVQFALCNYMMANTGDMLRLCHDMGDYLEGDGYADVDLLSYKFHDPSVIDEIVDLLNTIYEENRYEVVDGVGRRCDDIRQG